MRVVSVFATMQGEGSAAGSPAVFVRLTGCNLWNGYDDDRAKSRGVCGEWCDTYFATGKAYTQEQLLESIEHEARLMKSPVVVFTGGEPMLQLRKQESIATLAELRERDYRLHLETNGTLSHDILGLFEHVTVSPKRLRSVRPSDALKHIKLRRGTDLKIVHGQWNERQLQQMATWDFQNKFIQPCDFGRSKPDDIIEPLNQAAQLGFRVSVQTHKLVGMP